MGERERWRACTVPLPLGGHPCGRAPREHRENGGWIGHPHTPAPEPVAYRTIVVDAPWTPDLGGTWGARTDKARPQRFYPVMSLDQIMSIRLPAADQSHLYLWCLTQHLDWGYAVARAWGFDPVTLLTWCKPGPGVGRFRCNTEHVLVARRGSRHGNPFGGGGRHAQATDGTWFTWPRGRHSEKPNEFYALVERLSPAPRLDVFARSRRPGWDAAGDEVEGGVPIIGLAAPAPAQGGGGSG